MHQIPESEARELLRGRYLCEDAPPWAPMRMLPGTLEIGIGVLDYTGKSVKMYVRLNYQHSPKTRIIKYKFTVFRRETYGLERIYELQVNQFPKPVHDAHQQSHEHYGTSRIEGKPDWKDWKYEDVISYFCRQTNIEFKPEIPHPEQLQLRG